MSVQPNSVIEALILILLYCIVFFKLATVRNNNIKSIQGNEEFTVTKL